MNFKPILFSTPMVQAFLENRKTQTRRTQGLEKINKDPDRYLAWKGASGFFIDDLETLEDFGISPKYNTGDVLWVRETWFPTRFDYKNCLQYGYSSKSLIKYKADGDYDPRTDCVGRSWKPSIHMPKIVCRLFFKVEAVGLQRLQDISEEDAKSEGTKRGIFRYGPNQIKNEFHLELNNHADYRDGFKYIWHQIHSRDSWNKNPWVWVYDLRKIDKPVEFLKKAS